MNIINRFVITSFKPIFILGLSLFGAFGFSQTNTELDSIYALQAKHYKAKEYQNIIDLSHYAKTINLRNSQDSITFARITAYIGYANNKFNNFYGSIEGFEEALKFIPSKKDEAIINTNYNILYDLMTRYYSIRRYKKALSTALKAEEFINTTDFIRPGRHAWLYQRKFRIYSALGFYDKAKIEVKKIKKIAEGISSESLESQRYAWMRYYRADLLLSYNEALFLKEEDPKRYQNKLESLTSNIEYNLSKLDSIYTNTNSLKKPEKRAQFSNLSLYVGALYYVADFYKEIDEYSKSLTLISKAISLSKISKEPKRNVSEFLRFRANLTDLLGKTDDAIKQVDSILIHFNPNSYNVEETYVFKGDLYAKTKNLDSTLLNYHKAIRFMHNSSETLKSNFSNFSTRFQFTTDAKQLEHMCFMLVTHFVDNDKAQQQASLFNNVAYNEFLEGHDNLDLSEGNKQLFYKIIQNRIFLNQNNLKHKETLVSNIENVSNAFAWRKFSESRNLVQLPIIDSLENVEYGIKKQLILAKKERDSKREDSLNLKLQNFKKTVLKSYPVLADYTQDVFELNKFQRQLKSNQIVLKYLFFYDQFAIISITKDAVVFELKPWDANQKDLLKKHTDHIKDVSSTYTQNSELTELLIPQKALDYKSLIIIPDIPIYDLPFETLMNNSDYLIKEKTIHYSSHLRFVHVEGFGNRQSPPKTTIFAPTYSESQQKYAMRSHPVFLEGAQKEAKWLASLFPSESFVGQKATKANFIENKSKGNILHLAMHAAVDGNDPSLSHFSFANDEKLFLEEIYALKIPADMAVLSACNTGIGKQDGALSMATLQRAFNYAGTKSTIASLWEVPDASTSEIMIAFYDYLKQGESKSRALQQAKLDYLKNTKVAKLRHPYYWAGFVLYGKNEAVVKTTNVTPWIWVLLILVLAVAIALFRKKRFVKE